MKPIAAYSRRDYGNGTFSCCQECATAKRAAWRKKYPDRAYAWLNERRASKGYHRLYTYGLTPEDIKRMLIEQNHACAICETGLNGDKQTCVDHDHESGKVRALLCHRCNTGIGKFGDDARLVRRAAEYLAVHATQ